ncbi:hypothetical protein CTAM01_02163 [Colletotrichum tamarilloi]|uniref:Uncharacterized protein n=1 Tax=Colletotrichum tamarilloi TaxID=1209934 RepID=A0ABQ9RN11_9PEZI|nr:uncharacterized protein CTAM01_02163 [Colletotrichum tamarilloi]KAK1508377.1 hypothetical protein CTAM01_02163 [Colletotrichum tamarilloi]
MSLLGASRPSAPPRLSSLPWGSLNGPKGIQTKRNTRNRKCQINPPKAYIKLVLCFLGFNTHTQPTAGILRNAVCNRQICRKGTIAGSVASPASIHSVALRLRAPFSLSSTYYYPVDLEYLHLFSSGIYHWWSFCRFAFIISSLVGRVLVGFLELGTAVCAVLFNIFFYSSFTPFSSGRSSTMSTEHVPDDMIQRKHNSRRSGRWGKATGMLGIIGRYPNLDGPFTTLVERVKSHGDGRSRTIMRMEGGSGEKGKKGDRHSMPDIRKARSGLAALEFLRCFFSRPHGATRKTKTFPVTTTARSRRILLSGGGRRIP